MPVDVEKFTTHLRKNAKPHSISRCAKWVRDALEAGGANPTGHPATAKDWGPTLIRIGFREIPVKNPSTFPFAKGDIMVMQPYKGGTAGHIAGFDGRNWISDFVQRDFWAGPHYRKERPSYVVYRP
jgi:hypothetical protein